MRFTSSTTVGDSNYPIKDVPNADALSIGNATVINDTAQIAISRNTIDTTGDAQVNEYILSGKITSAGGSVNLTLKNGVTDEISIPSGYHMGVTVEYIIAGSTVFSGQRKTQFGRAEFFVKNNAGTPAISTVTDSILANDAILVRMSYTVVSGATDYLRINVIDTSSPSVGNLKISARVRVIQTLF